jgi:hypothetical protein
MLRHCKSGLLNQRKRCPRVAWKAAYGSEISFAREDHIRRTRADFKNEILEAALKKVRSDDT